MPSAAYPNRTAAGTNLMLVLWQNWHKRQTRNVQTIFHVRN